VLQRVAVCCVVFQCGRSQGSLSETPSEIETERYVLHYVAVCCGVGGVKAPFLRLYINIYIYIYIYISPFLRLLPRLRPVDMRCSVLQCVALCCVVLRCVAVWEETRLLFGASFQD